MEDNDIPDLHTWGSSPDEPWARTATRCTVAEAIAWHGAGYRSEEVQVIQEYWDLEADRDRDWFNAWHKTGLPTYRIALAIAAGLEPSEAQEATTMDDDALGTLATLRLGVPVWRSGPDGGPKGLVRQNVWSESDWPAGRSRP